MPSTRETAVLETAELRAAFLLDELFTVGEVNLVYTDLDRAIVTGAMTADETLTRPPPSHIWSSGARLLRRWLRRRRRRRRVT